MNELLTQLWAVIKQALISGLVPLVNQVVLSIVGILVAWILLRMQNISKRNSKFNFLWVLMLGYLNKAMTGPEKKAAVIARFHAVCRRGIMNRLFGRVSDEMLDAQLEGFYNSIMKGIAPLPNTTAPSLPSLK